MIKYSLLFLLLISVSTSCKKFLYDEEQFENQTPNPLSLLKIVQKDSVLLADSISLSTINFFISDSVDADRNSITLKTDHGLFFENDSQTIEVKLDKANGSDSLIGLVHLKSSNRVETAIIKVTYENSSKYIYVNFHRAFPEKIKVLPATLDIKPLNNTGGQVEIKIKTSRIFGQVTLNTETELAVYDSLNKQIGTFLKKESLTNDKQEASYTYVLGDSTLNNGIKYLGRLHAVGSTINESGIRISDTVDLFSNN